MPEFASQKRSCFIKKTRFPSTIRYPSGVSKKLFTSALLLTAASIGICISAKAVWVDLGEEPSAAYVTNQITTAAQCLPSNSEDASKLDIYHGAWIFRPGETGTVHLTCALPWPVGYKKGRSQSLALGRISYRDTTGRDERSSVVVEAFQRKDGSGHYRLLREVFSSDDHSASEDVTLWGKYGNDRAIDRNLGGSLFLRVTMRRGDSSDVLAFSHILWISPAPAYGHETTRSLLRTKPTGEPVEAFSTYNTDHDF